MIRKLLQIILVMILFSLPNYSESNEISKVTVKEYIVKHSLELGIDPALGLSIAKLESGFNHTKKSPYGAVGVFQLMPDTARRLGYNPYYVNENIKGGLSYYKMMYKKFGSVELALAAYNAGPGNVARYNGVPPFTETKRFVSNIMTEYKTQKTNPDPVIHQVKKTSTQIKPQQKSAVHAVAAKQSKPIPVSQNKLGVSPQKATVKPSATTVHPKPAIQKASPINKSAINHNQKAQAMSPQTMIQPKIQSAEVIRPIDLLKPIAAQVTNQEIAEVNTLKKQANLDNAS